MRFGSSTPKRPARPPKPTIDPDLLAVSPVGRVSFHSGERTAEESGPPRPVFVLGPLRSGTSLLTLSLSQHPNLYQVLETNWFEQFGMGLQQSYGYAMRFRNRSLLDVAGIEIEDFFAHFGESVNRMMLDAAMAGRLAPDNGSTHHNGRATTNDAATYVPQRWIDGTTSNAFCVFVLLRLFPQARFFHVVRDMHDVVETLTTTETRGTYKSHYLRMPEDVAYRHWIETTRACIDAEKTFGSQVVMRVRRNDLILAPEATLRRCFAFIDEPFTPLALRPFSSVKTTEIQHTSSEDSALHHMLARSLRAEAEDIYDQLLAETPSILDGGQGTIYAEDFGRIAAMEMDFSARSERMRSAIPSSIPGIRSSGSAKTGSNTRTRSKARPWHSLRVFRSIIDRT